MKPSVYIETTIVSYLTAWPSRDVIRAGQQQTTRLWWEGQRRNFELFTSQLVFLEASVGDARAAAERIAVLNQLAQVPIAPAAHELAEALLKRAALPAIAARDALHVAISATVGLDYLLTWNCRHLANAVLRAKIEQVCIEAGHLPPIICTPELLFKDK